ncbi:MAG TPA: hypothetical protein VN808_16355 [Stellaceae bacterium]|nr:hypothetical protein [Stellaceae bacterium]
MIGRTGFIAIAVVSALFGAHSLNPRELYNEMYPVETLKRDTFRICNAVDPAFVRAFKVDRETCYDKMPNAIEVALGRVRPGSQISAALLDPSRQAELLIQLAAMPPRQPVTVPQSLANAALQPCAKNDAPAPAVAATLGAPSLPPASARGATLSTTVLGNLPPIPRSAQNAVASRQQAPQPLAPGVAGTANGIGFDPVSTSDVGDKGPPAIVPLAPATACNDGA